MTPLTLEHEPTHVKEWRMQRFTTPSFPLAEAAVEFRRWWLSLLWQGGGQALTGGGCAVQDTLRYLGAWGQAERIFETRTGFAEALQNVLAFFQDPEVMTAQPTAYPPELQTTENQNNSASATFASAAIPESKKRRKQSNSSTTNSASASTSAPAPKKSRAKAPTSASTSNPTPKKSRAKKTKSVEVAEVKKARKGKNKA
jgi:hypothetical protein